MSSNTKNVMLYFTNNPWQKISTFFHLYVLVHNVVLSMMQTVNIMWFFIFAKKIGDIILMNICVCNMISPSIRDSTYVHTYTALQVFIGLVEANLYTLSASLNTV